MQLNANEDKNLWRKREVSLYIMLANFLLELKDYPLTISVMSKIVDKFSNGSQDVDVVSALGRLYLQVRFWSMSYNEFCTNTHRSFCLVGKHSTRKEGFPKS
jgi:hypothetical protein